MPNPDPILDQGKLLQRRENHPDYQKRVLRLLREGYQEPANFENHE
jgi:hypothetical protein